MPTVKKVVYGIDIKRVLRSKLVLGIADWITDDRAMRHQVPLFPPLSPADGQRKLPETWTSPL